MQFKPILPLPAIITVFKINIIINNYNNNNNNNNTLQFWSTKWILR